MLAAPLAACAFTAAPVLHGTFSGAGRVTSVQANQNEMEPEEGWNVANLSELMDLAEDADDGPTTKEIYEKPVFNIKDMPGVTAPMGFFDPVGFCEGASEGKIRFYREVELKHARVGMLAAVGFLVAENFHPLWGGNIDVPSYIAFQETPLQTFWPVVVTAIAVAEVFSVFSFQSPAGGELWSIRTDHEPGNFGFDPLSLKPSGASELLAMQNAELNNGRLAMIAAAGMIFQEAFVTHDKLF